MKLTADPVPPQALSSRDANNLTAMHKVTSLSHIFPSTSLIYACVFENIVKNLLTIFALREWN